MTTDSPDPAAPAGIRNATLGDLAAMLRYQQARKLDIVAPATAIRAHCGQLALDGTDPQLGPDGVTMTTGTYTPTEVCDQGLADKLAIPPSTCAGCATSAPPCTTPTSTAGSSTTPASSSSAAFAQHRAADRRRAGVPVGWI